jgi:flagellar biosynthesis protein FliP
MFTVNLIKFLPFLIVDIVMACLVYYHELGDSLVSFLRVARKP